MNYAPAEALLPLMPEAGETRSVVVAQLGQTLDGRIATVTGASKYINGYQALDHLHRLRAHVDAVLVGVSTVVADDPRLTVRRVDGKHPARVVIDPNGRLPADWGGLSDGAAPVYVITRPDLTPPPPAIAVPLEPEAGGFAPDAIVAALHALGLRRILVEGGADTLARFLDAGAVDLLHVLVAPMILGSGKEGFRLAPVDSLDEALRPVTRVHAFEDGDVLFTCDLRRSWQRD
ncbi:riboflavin-specific deaminase C-terminal domain-containing protein [Albimonas donghaensis]|uniref:Riboflavin-specific deaminase C-terminal domain-containing protein n=1 Tax=Albimonas donghaensis TaxID=356660 RepID=A0A1H2TEC6_9RHOB|nr:RibD family protein [Albimonas donghaensis]SDW42261.1 riboflavin-specific deaminase C-terminal domain-containing protein [Albimonas donghaensis]